MADIKETLELLEGVKLIAVTGGAVFADGKVNLADIPKLGALVKNFSTLKEAFAGVEELKTEITDLDAAEVSQIAAKAMEIVKAVKDELDKE